MSRISDDKLNHIAHRADGDFYAALLDLRDARAEIARLTEENARLRTKNIDIAAMWTMCLNSLRKAEARLAAATTVTEQLADALRAHEAWEADIILHADWGPDGMSPLPTLTQAQMDALSAVQSKRNAALTAFVASKQAGAGDGENQGGGDATSTPKARKGGGE